MDQAINRSSRFLGLSGAAAVIFGIVALVWPSITLVALVGLFAAYALVAGIFTVVAGLDMASEHVRHWVPLTLGGLIGIAIGVFTLFRPGITALALILLIAAWAIITGVFEIVAGVELTGIVKTAWALWLSGLLSLAFGILVAVRPGSGALAIVWLIGIYAIVTGVVRLFYAYRVYTDKEQVKKAVRTLEGAATPSR